MGLPWWATVADGELTPSAYVAPPNRVTGVSVTPIRAVVKHKAFSRRLCLPILPYTLEQTHYQSLFAYFSVSADVRTPSQRTALPSRPLPTPVAKRFVYPNGNYSTTPARFRTSNNAGSNPDLAFSVVSAVCLDYPYWAHTHEFGHNLGAQHNRENSGYDLEYAHGKRFCIR